MTTQPAVEDNEPWYRQFWPWFLITLPAIVVVAGIVTVLIAIDGADNLVVDDYYKQGMGINRLLAQDDLASDLNIQAELTVDKTIGEIKLLLRGDFTSPPQQLNLLWAHPADEDLDFDLVLQKTRLGDGGSIIYSGELSTKIAGRWYIQLSPTQPPLWRLKQALIVSSGVDDDEPPQQFSLVATKGE
mgnify:CR=1 FL=1